MTIISGVINTSFNPRPQERSLRRPPMRIVAVAFAASALAFGVIAFAAGGPLPDVSAALAAAVTEVEPTAFFKFPRFPNSVAELQGYAVDHPNVTVTTAAALEGLRFPEKLDLFWISRNYHDLHDKFMGPVDTAAFNKAVYEALKPGGFYVVLDHSAAPGAAADVTETLHRIEPSTVRREVEAVGFKFDSESSILANPADPRTATVFDQTIRGHTDQFILKFRKPK
jgi:predicted methyltransferase